MGMMARATVMGLWLVAAMAPMGLAQEDETDTIEIVIEHSVFHVKTTTLKVDEQVVIVLRNLDSFEHGFTSPAFRGLDVRVEAEGVVTYGKGIEGLYLGPEEEVWISFTPIRSGKLAFRCDLHPSMAGEALYVTVSAT